MSRREPLIAVTALRLCHSPQRSTGVVTGVENFFERIKRYRRVATRYDRLAETFLGFVCLAILFTLGLA